MVVAFIQRAVMQGIPLLFGSTGEILTEKAGNLNLGTAGVMYVGGMLHTISQLVVACIRGTVGLVGATAFMGSLLNAAMGDQYLSILVTSDLFRDVYRVKGYESRLLSRTIEDSCTVTSVLVPWNTCAMAQAASLRVATVEYLPYCFFNLLSPLVTLCVAAVGHGIVRVRSDRTPMAGSEVCGG